MRSSLSSRGINERKGFANRGKLTDDEQQLSPGEKIGSDGGRRIKIGNIRKRSLVEVRIEEKIKSHQGLRGTSPLQLRTRGRTGGQLARGHLNRTRTKPDGPEKQTTVARDGEIRLRCPVERVRENREPPWRCMCRAGSGGLKWVIGPARRTVRAAAEARGS